MHSADIAQHQLGACIATDVERVGLLGDGDARALLLYVVRLSCNTHTAYPCLLGQRDNVGQCQPCGSHADGVDSGRDCVWLMLVIHECNMHVAYHLAWAEVVGQAWAWAKATL